MKIPPTSEAGGKSIKNSLRLGQDFGAFGVILEGRDLIRLITLEQILQFLFLG